MSKFIAFLVLLISPCLYAQISGGGGSSSSAVTKIVAGTNVTLSPTNGLGNVTINATGGGGGLADCTDTTGVSIVCTVPFSAPSIATTGSGGSGLIGVNGTTPTTCVSGSSGSFASSATSNTQFCDNGVVTTPTRTIASGTIVVPVTLLTANTCDTSATTATATGATTTDAPTIGYASDPTATTGYGGGTAGGISIRFWVTANTFNIKRCNESANSITPGALSLNWRLTR